MQHYTFVRQAVSVGSQIFANHAEYKGFGQPDTSLASDDIIGAVSNKAPYILDTALMTDGAMLASKVLAV